MKRTYKADKVIRVIRYGVTAGIINMLVSDWLVIVWSRSAKKSEDIVISESGQRDLKMFVIIILTGGIVKYGMTKKLGTLESQIRIR